jgi:hypothetical protein
MDLGCYEEQNAYTSSGRIYVSKTGSGMYPYNSTLKATSDPVAAFNALAQGARDTVLFLETGCYTAAYPCSIRVNNAVIITQPGTVCTLARASASVDSFPMVVIKSVENAKISGLAFNGNQTAGCAVQMSSASAKNPVLNGLDIFNLSSFVNGQG